MIEAGSDTFSLDLHPRMTVIAGVGKAEREGLITELIGGLGRGRSGCTSRSRRMPAPAMPSSDLRGPATASSTSTTATDVTAQFTTGDHLDVLGAGRADPVRRRAASSACSPSDLVTRSRVEEYVVALARIDQGRLWDVADRVRDRERHLAETAQAAGSDVEDAAVFEEIERRHRTFETAQATAERVRHLSFVLGAGAALAGMVAGTISGMWAAVPLLAVAVAATAASIVYWRRMERARRDEDEALRSAGSSSYLSFQINRVNGLLTSDHARRQMMRAAEEHRAALAEWRLLVGDIPVSWAVEHRSEVRAQAARLRDTLAVRNPMAITMSHDEESTAELAHALLQRLTLLKRIGAGGESFPLLLDDALTDIDPSAKPELLELLTKASAGQQVIYLTDDEDVASWARVEALTGLMTVVEPAPASASPRTDRRSGSIAI